MLATPNHGTTAATTALTPFGRCTPSCWQMAPSSKFIRALNKGDETPGAVSYTSLYGNLDELVQPKTTARLAGGANYALSQICPGRPEEHVTIALDAVAHAMAIDALTNPGPANPARLAKRTCHKLLMPDADPLAFVLLIQNDPAPPNSFPAVTTSEPPLQPYAV
jgi:hypothetical protein